MMRLHYLPPLLLAALLTFLGCSRGGGPVTTPTALATAVDWQQPNHDCWSYALREGQLLSAWVSPRLPGEVPGGFRFVNLVYHDASQPAPILLHSQPVPNEARDSVQVHSGELCITAAPTAGKRWLDVCSQADLTVDLSGP